MWWEKFRNFLEVSNLEVTGGKFNITIAQQPLNDGEMYLVNLNEAFPTITGTETVFVVNGITDVQLLDHRASELFSSRLKRGMVLCMVYTQNSVGGVPVFLVKGAFRH